MTRQQTRSLPKMSSQRTGSRFPHVSQGDGACRLITYCMCVVSRAGRPAPQHGESMFPRVLTRSGVREEAPSPQHDCVPQMPVRAGPAEILLGQRRLYSISTQRARRKERAHGPGDPALTRRGRRKPPAASTPWTQPRQRPGQSPRTRASARASCPHCRSRSGTSSAR